MTQFINAFMYTLMPRWFKPTCTVRPMKEMYSWFVELCFVMVLGPDSIQRCHLTSIGNPIVEIRRSYDRLISTMGFPLLVRWHLHIESGSYLQLYGMYAFFGVYSLIVDQSCDCPQCQLSYPGGRIKTHCNKTRQSTTVRYMMTSWHGNAFRTAGPL